MIAKIIRVSSFVEPCFYAMRGELKRPEVLAANGVRTSSAGEMAADFELQRSARPGLRQAVEHIALAWPPGETDKLTDNEVMVRAAMLYLEERKIDPATTQWALVRHHDQEHPHCHLILNRVTDDGDVLSDKRSHHVSAAACRKVEAAMGFVDAAKLGAAKKLQQAVEGELPADVAERVQCKDLIRQALEKHLPAATTVRELREALATEGVRMKATMQQGGQLQAVVFEADAYPGLHVKGSEVAREYSGVGLRKTLEAQAKLRLQVAGPVLSESSAALPLEGSLPVVPRPVVAAPVQEDFRTTVAPPETGKKLPAVSVADRTPSVSLPERNTQLPMPVSEAIPPPTVVAAGSPAKIKEATGPTVDLSPVSISVAADSSAAAPPVVAATEQPRSGAVISKQVAAIPPAEIHASGPADSPANAAKTAPVGVPKGTWQHGIIRMLDAEKGTSEERLKRVQTALVAAGATVGEIVAPVPGRNTVSLLPYSFDPASPQLPEVNKVLLAVQASYDSDGVSTSKVQERPHPWHQPGTLPEADNLKWPEREGQFNQAQILVDDPIGGQIRANKIARDLHGAGASVSEITRDDQGLLTMQIRYHTYTPTIDNIDTVLTKVAASSTNGVKLRESQQDKDARFDGVIQITMRQKEAGTYQQM